MTVDRHRPQRNWGTRIRDFSYRGMRLVTLENELLRVSVLAGKGADIVELNYKPRDLDFVWLNPGGVRSQTDYLSTSPDPLATFVDTYPGGWQEILPSGGAPSSHLGAQFGQHGEVSNLPWDVRIDEDSERAVAVTFSVRGHKAPFHLERTMRLEAGEPAVAFRETLTNESDVAVQAMWGHHIAFGRPFLGPGCRIDLPPGATVIPHPEAIHPRGRRVRGEQRPTWPLAEGPDGATVDLSVLPPKGTLSEMLYLADLKEGRYRITRPEDGIGFEVRWDISVMPYLWFWQELGASEGYPWYGRLYTIGLEPFSSYPTNGLAEAVANGTALDFAPRARREFWLEARVDQRG